MILLSLFTYLYKHTTGLKIEQMARKQTEPNSLQQQQIFSKPHFKHSRLIFMFHLTISFIYFESKLFLTNYDLI